MNKLLFLFLLLVFCYPSLASRHFNKVLVIVFENTDFNDVVRQPYFKTLNKEGAILTNFYALSHPSQGNYIAMISGTIQGVNDEPVSLPDRHIGNLLEEAGKTWKVYAQDYPGNCFLGETSGPYARRHVPFLSFSNVQNNPARCSKVVNADEFINDFNASKLPDYSLYVPNVNNDGHDTNVAEADRWFFNNFDKILHSKKFPRDLLVIITFDEAKSEGNQVYTLFWGAEVRPGAVSKKPYNHFSTLKTIERGLGLRSLTPNDLNAALINDIWEKR
jgi:hypothetical protein